MKHEQRLNNKSMKTNEWNIHEKTNKNTNEAMTIIYEKSIKT